MRKKLLIAMLAGTFLFVPTVFAVSSQNGQDSDSGQIKKKIEEMKSAGQARKEQIKAEVLTKAKNAAKKRIDNIISKYNRIKKRVASMKVISEDRKDELSAKIDAEIAKLETAKEKIDDAITVAEVKAVMEDVKTQTKNSVATIKEIVAAIHATHLENIVTKLTTILDKLTAKVTELKTAGKNVMEMEALQTQAKKSLADAKTHISSKEFKDAKEDILAARKTLVELSQKIKAAKGTEEDD